MEGYTTTKEQHHRRNDGQTAGHSSPAPLFDPKMFKANREVLSIICALELIIVTSSLIDRTVKLEMMPHKRP